MYCNLTEYCIVLCVANDGQQRSGEDSENVSPNIGDPRNRTEDTDGKCLHAVLDQRLFSHIYRIFF